jgi:hypothetical protein
MRRMHDRGRTTVLYARVSTEDQTMNGYSLRQHIGWLRRKYETEIYRCWKQ